MKNVKNKLFLATAIIALAACSDNTYMGEPNGGTGTGGAISFNMNTPAATRATQEDATAATTLGNRFIVWGEKNESGTTAATAANTVFQNYTVVYNILRPWRKEDNPAGKIHYSLPCLCTKA